MTVLRSRKVLPAVNPKTSLVTEENGAIEPLTPSKTIEFMSEKSNSSTPSTSSRNAKHEPPELGLGFGSSTMVLETGVVQRRSARLATKLGVSEGLSDFEVRSEKRKKIDRNSFVSELRDVERRIMEFGLRVEELEKAHVSMMGQQNLVGAGMGKLVVGQGKVKDSGNATKLELGSDVGISMVGTGSNGKLKRKYSIEMKSLGLEFGGKNEVKKSCLNLRSGKRVLKEEGKRDGERPGGDKESDILLSSDVLVKTRSEATMKKPDSGGCMGFSRVDKGKQRLGCKTSVTSESSSDSDDEVGLPFGDSDSDASYLLRSSDSKEIAKGEGVTNIESSVSARRRLSKDEKGKMKLGDNSNDINEPNVEVENLNGSSVSASIQSAANAALQDGVPEGETAGGNDARRGYRERFRNVARRIASRFAHFSSQDELGNHAPDVSRVETPPPDADNGIEDWPGPFSTAMKIMKDRETSKNGERHPTASGKSEAVELKWVPANSNLEHPKCLKPLVPSLQELCLSILARNSDAVTSLDCVPDMLRHKISWFLCDRRRMDSYFLELLVHGSPTEIRVRDCSWLSEEQFTKTFEGCSADKLTVLQFDQCGCCMPDYTLAATLARSPNCLPALTTISLKGAYRLSDVGLRMLVSSAPFLKSVDLSQCPLLTSEGICYLADSLNSSLRELYLDNCCGIDAILLFPALLKLGNLEVLSVAGIQSVSDDFVNRVVSLHGCRMKELVLADCMELTDSSLKVIGDGCSGLRALDLSNLRKLTDVGVGHLANGCQEIQSLKFCRSALSDEAIAAYLDISGAFLKELSLNNIVKVANNTALALARNCRNLQTLDLSWCRNLSNEALGLIVDTCTSLELLKLFGCTQVTNVFLDGHSNPQVKLLGLKLTPVFKHINLPDFLQGPLRYSSDSA